MLRKYSFSHVWRDHSIIDSILLSQLQPSLVSSPATSLGGELQCCPDVAGGPALSNLSLPAPSKPSIVNSIQHCAVQQKQRLGLPADSLAISNPINRNVTSLSTATANSLSPPPPPPLLSPTPHPSLPSTCQDSSAHTAFFGLTPRPLQLHTTLSSTLDSAKNNHPPSLLERKHHPVSQLRPPSTPLP